MYKYKFNSYPGSGHVMKQHKNLLITGDKGYIGGMLLRATRPRPYTLDESDCFDKWKELLNTKLECGIGTIIHLGAISDAFYACPDIFVWNYEATKYLSDIARDYNMFFIFINYALV